MFQATAVRAAGFAIVSLSALAPAVKCVAQLFTTLLADFDVEGPVRNHDVYQYL